MLSRLAPGALFAGIAAAVVGLSKLHASQLGTYDYSGSSRFAWSLAYIGILAVAAYGVGPARRPPDAPLRRGHGRGRRRGGGPGHVRRAAGGGRRPAASLRGLRQRPPAGALVPADREPGPRRPDPGRAPGPGAWSWPSTAPVSGPSSRPSWPGGPSAAAHVVATLVPSMAEVTASGRAAPARRWSPTSGPPSSCSTGPRRTSPRSWPRPPPCTPPASGCAPSRCSTRSGWASCPWPSWSGCR